MDPEPRTSDTELLRLLDEERKASEGERSEGQRSASRGRKHFEGALPLEDFLREIEDPRT